MQVDAAVEAARRAAQPARKRFAIGFQTGHEINWLPQAMHVLRGIEVDNRKRIQRVAVGTDNALLDGRSELAAMSEFSETTVLDHPGEINIGLGAVVVLDGDGLRR